MKQTRHVRVCSLSSDCYYCGFASLPLPNVPFGVLSVVVLVFVLTFVLRAPLSELSDDEVLMLLLPELLLFALDELLPELLPADELLPFDISPLPEVDEPEPLALPVPVLLPVPDVVIVSVEVAEGDVVGARVAWLVPLMLDESDDVVLVVLLPHEAINSPNERLSILILIILIVSGFFSLPQTLIKFMPLK
jgi:hypothetical protein